MMKAGMEVYRIKEMRLPEEDEEVSSIPIYYVKRLIKSYLK